MPSRSDTRAGHLYAVTFLAMAIVVELLGGIIVDVDVNTVYRSVFTKLDQMVAEMEELRG